MVLPQYSVTCKDPFVYTPNQWETMLQCNVISHWLGWWLIPGHITATGVRSPYETNYISKYSTVTVPSLVTTMVNPNIQIKFDLNSLAPGNFEWNFRYVIFKRISVIMVEASLVKLPCYECHWTSNDDQSTLVQVMAWCHQATSHYLNQCWPRSPMPYGITSP